MGVGESNQMPLSTAIRAFGSAARMPTAYGADGSTTTNSTVSPNAAV
jgi:hypothetical protein